MCVSVFLCARGLHKKKGKVKQNNFLSEASGRDSPLHALSPGAGPIEPPQDLVKKIQLSWFKFWIEMCVNKGQVRNVWVTQIPRCCTFLAQQRQKLTNARVQWHRPNQRLVIYQVKQKQITHECYLKCEWVVRSRHHGGPAELQTTSSHDLSKATT